MIPAPPISVLFPYMTLFRSAFQANRNRLVKARNLELSLIRPMLHEDLVAQVKQVRRALEDLQRHLETPAPKVFPKIGRAHVLTPVTPITRIPSSTCRKTKVL